MTEPVKVTAPMKTPRNSSTFRMFISTGSLVRQTAEMTGHATRLQVALSASARHDGGHVAQFDMGVEADEDRRKADQRVHDGNQLRHLRHLHPVATTSR
jgi:hypothetical protein